MAKAGVPACDELQFCTEKIEQNFSNYSSWHYRSKLLPLLYPNEDATRKGWPICEEKLKSELELVLTAAFTDPKDSSAWFYQRWLLGYEHNNQEIVSAFVSQEKAIMGFAKAVSLQREDLSIDCVVDQLADKSRWRSANGLDTDLIWYFEADKTSPLQLPLNTDCLSIHVLSDGESLNKTMKRDGDSYFALAKETSFGGTLSQPIVDELKGQLSSCEQLLEFEPESKWTLLTAALLMRAIDREGYHQQTIANLEKLKTVDSCRVGYYSDLISKWHTERVLLQWLKREDVNAPVDFSAVQLTCLDYEQYFAVAKSIELGSNEMQPRIMRKMKVLKNIE